MRDDWVPTGDGSLYVEARGEGPTAIVMPVAWGMSHDFYLSLFDSLDLPLELIYFDPQGTGKSSPLPAGWDPALIVDETEAVRIWSGSERPILFGHASGAFMALAYTLDHPNTVEALILSAPFASYRRANDMASGRLERSPHWETFQQRVGEIKRVALSPEERFRSLYKEQRMVDMFDYGAHYFAMADAADAARFNTSMHDEAEMDFLDELESIDVPVLIVTGIQDPLSTIEESRLIAAELPFVRLIELDATGHFPFVERPDQFSEAVRAFLSYVGADAPVEEAP